METPNETTSTVSINVQIKKDKNTITNDEFAIVDIK